MCFVVLQLLSHVWLFVTPWTAARQASLSFTISQSLLKLLSIESVIPPNYLILSSLSPPAFKLSQHQGLFQWVGFSHLMAQLIKNLPAMWETWVWSLGWEDPLEKRKATHSSILAWRISWTVQSMGLQRAGHDWATSTFAFSDISTCSSLCNHHHHTCPECFSFSETQTLYPLNTNAHESPSNHHFTFCLYVFKHSTCRM